VGLSLAPLSSEAANLRLGLGADYWFDQGAAFQLNLGVDTHLAGPLHVGGRFGVSLLPKADTLGIPIDLVLGVLAKRASEASRSAAQAMLTEVEAGAELATLAEEAGLEVVSVSNAPRGHGVPDAVTVAAVFRLPRPEGEAPELSVVEAQDGHALVMLSVVTDGETDPDSLIERQQLRRQLANASASTESWALVKQLREAAEVKVFEENLGVSR
jgi:hypothetical protein